MRLIDADVLKKVLVPGKQKSTVEAQVLNVIDEAPTVDAVAVVYGEWEKRGQTLICTKCEKAPTLQIKTLHCPNCGSKMSTN